MANVREMALELTTALAAINATKDALARSMSKKEREALQLNLTDAAANVCRIRDTLRTL